MSTCSRILLTHRGPSTPRQPSARPLNPPAPRPVAVCSLSSLLFPAEPAGFIRLSASPPRPFACGMSYPLSWGVSYPSSVVGSRPSNSILSIVAATGPQCQHLCSPIPALNGPPSPSVPLRFFFSFFRGLFCSFLLPPRAFSPHHRVGRLPSPHPPPLPHSRPPSPPIWFENPSRAQGAKEPVIGLSLLPAPRAGPPANRPLHRTGARHSNYPRRDLPPRPLRRLRAQIQSARLPPPQHLVEYLHDSPPRFA